MATQTQTRSVRNQSIWTVDVELPRFRSLRKKVEKADVCVVGAGIAGLSTAYLLTQAGKSVVVLDDGPIASGMTQVTTAHLATALDNRYLDIERVRGEEGARLAAESHSAAIDRIEGIIHKEALDCDFDRVDGYLFLAPGKEEEFLDRELASARRAGLTRVEKLERAPLEAFDTGPCLRFPRQAQFHPLKYLDGLARAIVRDGGRIYCQTHVDEVTDGSPARVKAGEHVVNAESVVVATNTPINLLVGTHTKQAPYMTYVVAGRVPEGSVTRALYWDTAEPFHYLRLQRLPEKGGRAKRTGSPEILIVGGEDHKTGQADDTQQRHGRLESWARERFPLLGPIEFVWAGQVMESFDGLALIGRSPAGEDHVFVVTGDSGMGMTHGTIAGILLTDLILGRENPWTGLYDPARTPPGAVGRFVEENLNVAAQYVDWLTGGDKSVDEIAMDSGAVIRHGLSKVAIYRDQHGLLHARSAVCPHLGCIVAWNAAEKSWDCPCHGSRFDKLGHVINGPSNVDLAPVEQESVQGAGRRAR